MIKANELRIGSTYKWRESIVTLSQKDLRDILELEEIENILPIQITPETLEEHGFKLLYGFYGLQHHYGYIAIMFENSTLMIEDLNNDSINVKAPKYLHQLQNFYFALTGEELLITL
jgi:hypothetical protein